MVEGGVDYVGTILYNSTATRKNDRMIMLHYHEVSITIPNARPSNHCLTCVIHQATLVKQLFYLVICVPLTATSFQDQITEKNRVPGLFRYVRKGLSTMDSIDRACIEKGTSSHLHTCMVIEKGRPMTGIGSI